ncbi:alpha/beta hydrolase family protein [Flavobacterium ajazii]|uniref:alpha/beta hydrolase family protein n=1 Tax=Flavobacterium ajazii TaxID=2692318 RepID=UPI0013D61639|nr:prolyl oligopeptidase family serine peptidase [Flavobacterium ajazii]
MKKDLRFVYGILSVLIFELVTCSASGQGLIKKNISNADYKLWSTMELKDISENGQWYTYSLSYEQGADTLFVKSSKANKNYAFSGTLKGTFLKEKWFCSRNDQNELSLLNLVSGKIEKIKNADNYLFTSDQKYLIIFLRTDNKTKIIIKTLDGSAAYEIENVKGYAYNPKSNQLIYSKSASSGCRVCILTLNEKFSESKIIESGNYNYTNFVWQPNAASAVFIRSKRVADSDIKELVCYKTNTQKIFVFEPDSTFNFDEKYRIKQETVTDLIISEDGKRVFFKIETLNQKLKQAEKKIVQVWNADDKYLEPAEREKDGSIKMPKIAVWQPEKNDFRILTDTVFSKIMLAGSENFAVLWNPVANEPQPYLHSARDYKTINLDNGVQQLFLKDFNYRVNNISLSPAGKYITYFKNNHWWIYDIQKNIHTNLTADLDESFSVEDLDRGEGSFPYGNPAWTPGDQSILLYDQYDVWEITAENLKAEKLTHGRQEKVTYRFKTTSIEQKQKNNFDGVSSGIINLGKSIIMESKNGNTTGLWWYKKNNLLRSIVLSENKISDPVLASGSESVVYKEESFETPPELFLRDKKEKKVRTLYQSNSHFKNFNSGTSSVIHYRNSNGNSIKGALFYPANYSSEKLYPMIVHVYEKQSETVHDYINPSLYSGNGFNVSHYTNNGYFVLLPDIVYEFGNPGNSAVDCVVAATKKALEIAPVDPKRIGLIGHSFGGYEADYIITQTDIFSAAVAGAAITDLISGYLYVSWNFNRPNFFQYEYGQLRMNGSIFKNFLGYLANSPVYYADRVTTPLLSWAGEADRHVHYYQTLEFYLALRRLGKKHVMLLYPDQQHVLSDKEQQKHLTEYVMRWFDHYLSAKSNSEFVKAN